MTLVERGSAGLPAVSTLFDPYEEIAKKARPKWTGAMSAGYLVMLVFFGGFGGFAALAPLQSAIMAPAEVRVDNERKLVQHPTGGIATDILVREGQRVEEGQILLRLDPTRDRAQATVLNRRYMAALAGRARLIAERDALDRIQFPEEVLAAADQPEVAELISGETALFNARAASREGQLSLILGQIDQARTQIESVRVERTGVQEQLGFIEQELEGVRELYEKGLERMPRLLALERNRSALRGAIGRLSGQMAQLEKQIGDSELRIIQIEREFQREVLTLLEATNAEIRDVAQQLPVMSAQVRRLELRAPRAGTVIDLKVHTIGQVVNAAETVMQIVPEDEDLIVVARVRPRDIDSINSGVTKVQVRMTAFSQRFTHPIEAHLESVSSDVINPPQGMPFYRVLIRLDKVSRDHVLPGIELTSGMPATAMIGVGEKTLLSYLVEPLTRSIQESLREP